MWLKSKVYGVFVRHGILEDIKTWARLLGEEIEKGKDFYDMNLTKQYMEHMRASEVEIPANNLNAIAEAVGPSSKNDELWTILLTTLRCAMKRLSVWKAVKSKS